MYVNLHLLAGFNRVVLGWFELGWVGLKFSRVELKGVEFR